MLFLAKHGLRRDLMCFVATKSFSQKKNKISLDPLLDSYVEGQLKDKRKTENTP